MSDFFIFFTSAILNCLFVYLATDYFFRFLDNSTKQTEIKELAIRFARVILGLSIWAGSGIYFTIGATALMNLEASSQAPPGYGWRNTIGIVNFVLPVLVVMLMVRKVERRGKEDLASLKKGAS